MEPTESRADIVECGCSVGELGELVRGIPLALLAATELEAAPLLSRGTLQRRLFVAGSPWSLLSLPQVSASSSQRVLVIVSGYDKANTAHALTCLLQVSRPRLVLQFGIAGGFGSAGLGVGDLVVPSVEIYGDTGSSSPQGWLSTEAFGLPVAQVAGRTYWNSFPLEAALVARAAKLLSEGTWPESTPLVASGPAVTVSQVSGRREEAETLAGRWDALIESMEGAAAAHICALYRVPFLEVRAVSNLVGDRDRAAWDIPGAAERAAEAAALLAGRLPVILDEEVGRS